MKLQGPIARLQNYLPSISGSNSGITCLEKFIWRVGIALHCLPRILAMSICPSKNITRILRQAGKITT
ncbi:hypothetical protein OS493_008345 [Desmophyllum pertusum]|uniref:Uncharacterized protein n=1 Tax=Desmophyllum pertusum TaxID=174260 RepID=A0A9X0A5B0_9CNID|nr:hypothetical protein OS493_008345 [Desmophyllum pertusum]